MLDYTKIQNPHNGHNLQEAKRKKLEKIIEGFYVITEDSFKEKLSIILFRITIKHYHTIKMTIVEVSEDDILISPIQNGTLKTVLVNKYIKPQKVVYKSAINEITIYFKPAGLHYFINDLDTLKGNYNKLTLIL